MGLTTPDGHLDRVAGTVDEDEFAFCYCFLGCFGGYFGGFADVFEDSYDVDGGVFFNLAEFGDFDKIEAGLWESDGFVTLTISIGQSEGGLQDQRRCLVRTLVHTHC